MHDYVYDLPFGERPRERLRLHGAQTLSDAELIAILVGSGMHGKNALMLARELLANGRTALARMELKKLERVRGLGPVKAMRITAAFEIARRFGMYEEGEKTKPDYDMEGLSRALVRRFAQVRQERMGSVFLDMRDRVIKQKDIFIGTINHSAVSTREIIRLALEEDAVGVVLYHNHPSGDPSPSMEDMQFTTKIKDSLALCDLKLVDHVIIGEKRCFSMGATGNL
jgi:DNA repair protein RadC